MGRKVCVIGNGMTQFKKPGNSPDYHLMAKDAGTQALEDAGISYKDVEQAVVGYVYGESTSGERAMYELGLTGIPMYNVNNNCSTGSTALMLAKQLVEGGIAECVMAMGFEKMQKGALGATFTDRLNPMDKHMGVVFKLQKFNSAPPTSQLFGGAGREHQEKYGTKTESFAKIAVKNRKHAIHNPRSIFHDELSVEEVMESPHYYGPLTRLQCCPPTCGAAAAIVCSEEFAKKHAKNKPVYIVGQSMTTDMPSSFEDNSMIKVIGYDMSKLAAQHVYEQSGIGIEDVDVIELHDCFTANELLTYEALGMCAEGEAEKLIESDACTYGGEWVVNPSGGLLSKGHPLGATGLAQCAEICWQLRGGVDKRQVEGARVGLQHNLGLGGACVVTMYQAS
ncbi:MAG: lipid-transfer protein [Pseudomonadota bacterium]|nr:lipid-transfer protein [Pseudomonadota bacterium]